MKVRLILISVMAILFTSLSCISLEIKNVQASETIYIRADGSIEPPTTPIVNIGNTNYTLTDNISDQIVIQRDGILLDGAGFKLQTISNYSIGINVTNRNDVKIINIHIRDFYIGILIDNSTNCGVFSSRIEAIGEYGVSISETSHVEIIESRMTNRSTMGGIGIGVGVTHSDNINITRNMIEEVNYCIRILGSIENTVSNCKISENTLHNSNIGIYAHLLNSSITLNNSTNNLQYGITLHSSKNTVIFRNNLKENMWGIENQHCEPTANNSIFENMIVNNDYGVVLRETYGNEYYHNSFINNSVQIFDWSNQDPSFSASDNDWDKGHLRGGNFWSDHDGNDDYSGFHQNETCADGIVDNPYIIDERNRDSYPLVNPWFSHLAPPVARFSYYPIESTVDDGTVFNASASYDLDEDIDRYHFDFGDGNLTFTANPIIIYVYTHPAKYNATLTIIDHKGHTSSNTQMVWVRMRTCINVSTDSWSSADGFAINVTGALSDGRGNPLRDETVILQGNGEMIRSIQTDEFGNYMTTWTPPTIKGFLLTVEWDGNLTHFQTQNTTSLIMNTSNHISLRSTTSLIGYQVKINGHFAVNEIDYSNAPILIAYSVTEGQTWNDITLVITDLEGQYSAIWMPTSTGSFVVKTSWTGNPNYLGASATVNFMVTPADEQNIFSVTSNSTISTIAFNSSNRELRFTVSGPAGTAGYVTAYIADSLVSNITAVKTYLNGTQSDHTATLDGETWQIHLVYSHSTHEVVVSLGSLEGFTPPPMQNLLLLLLFGVAVLVIGLLLYKRKRTRTQ